VASDVRQQADHIPFSSAVLFCSLSYFVTGESTSVLGLTGSDVVTTIRNAEASARALARYWGSDRGMKEAAN
jgi:hypothetical protein